MEAERFAEQAEIFLIVCGSVMTAVACLGLFSSIRLPRTRKPLGCFLCGLLLVIFMLTGGGLWVAFGTWQQQPVARWQQQQQQQDRQTGSRDVPGGGGR